MKVIERPPKSIFCYKSKILKVVAQGKYALCGNCYFYSNKRQRCRRDEADVIAAGYCAPSTRRDHANIIFREYSKEVKRHEMRLASSK